VFIKNKFFFSNFPRLHSVNLKSNLVFLFKLLVCFFSYLLEETKYMENYSNCLNIIEGLEKARSNSEIIINLTLINKKLDSVSI
jgi:hypothetical protein